ncbi:F-box protein At5g07610-like [Nicotiana tabacum]|uniref:F-box protein At5g07610-like n=2 Tax=Nicotiana TaxID=4085 RepID=A0A1S4CG64_TOBAC|nr:PREDICTED: F-box protein At5g07610 [Nicotiana sylvestris]XP_016500165.1 PREDICTED: F-box protein At5g07610-like [Nicotiana tabacum]
MQGLKIKIPKTAELEQPTSAEIVASIDDLLIQILLHLPITSLLYFKTVSKHWLSLITNPKFSILCHPNPNPAIGLFLPSYVLKPKFDYVHFNSQNLTKPPFKKLKFTKDPSGITILQSCNGLLLCCSNRIRQPINYYVYNPTTKHYTTLPKSFLGTENSNIHGLSLAFDPIKSPRYKVICIRNSVSSPEHYQIEIYSSETGPWRLSGGPFIADVNFSKGVYWNGSIHWISTIGNLNSLCYNIDLESLGVIPMPPVPDNYVSVTISYFGESCDHLHLIQISNPQIQFDVYEMKRDYSEWFVKYKVDLHPIASAFPMMTNTYLDPFEIDYYNFAILSLVRGRREEDAFMVLGIPGDCKAIRYNLVSKSYEKLCDDEVGDEQVWFFSAAGVFEYIESLCCV